MKKNKVKIIIISLVAFIGMVCVWPIGLIQTEKESASRATNYIPSRYVKDEVIYGQTFIPAHDYIESLSLTIVRSAAELPEAEGLLTLTLYDASNTAIVSVTEPVNALEDSIYHEFVLGVKVEKGSQYYYTIEVNDCKNEGVQILFGDTAQIELPENTVLHYGGEDFPMYSTMAVYKYKSPLGIENIAMYYAWIVMAALLLIYGTGSKEGQNEKD